MLECKEEEGGDDVGFYHETIVFGSRRRLAKAEDETIERDII